jgi:hypothetical protein
METILKMNYGQHMLFSYLCISIAAMKEESVLTYEVLDELIKQVIELTDVEHYDSIEECPDHMIMVNPQDSYGIFCDFWDENEVYFVEYL